ncbi:tRNA (guanine(10)-N(2))-dimethyltransferase [Candidatus Woesearchaeota archaeon]|nr:tRNA (guanine(10)-N(2))-dimethyltransferase [Candidatus Woesearchaeota archaeon]
MQTIDEGKAKVHVYVGKISKELPVFYNPVMKLNRDISVLLLNSIDKNEMRIASPLAGSGVREIRFLKELKKGKIEEIFINDICEDAVRLIRKNLRLNKLKAKVSKKDATEFLFQSTGFDYIDIDPFGSPNPFLDSAVRRISREGILAVTATDTACLCGTSPDACVRKYWAKPLRNEFMHETGLRILIRKVQLIGAQFDRALIPVFSYSKEHYFRIFFCAGKGKKKVDDVLKEHGYLLYCPGCLNRKTTKTIANGRCGCGKEFDYAGPIWLGRLFSEPLVRRMIEKNSDKKIRNFLETALAESRTDAVGFYDIHKICKKYKLRMVKKEKLLETIGHSAPTHITGRGIKTGANISEIVNCLKK